MAVELTEKDKYLIALCEERPGYSVREFTARYGLSVKNFSKVLFSLNKKLRRWGEPSVTKPEVPWKYYDKLHGVEDLEDHDIIAQYRKAKRMVKVLKNRAVIEDRFLAALDQLRSHHPPRQVVSRKKIEKGKRTKAQGCVLISDIHAGEFVTAEETGGFGEYNMNVFNNMADFLATEIPELFLNRWRGWDIERLNLWFLGDMVSGVIHDELEKTNEYGIIELCLRVADKMAELILNLAAYFPKVRCVGIFGNHGRLGKKKYYKRRFDNFDWLIYHMIKRLCARKDNIEWVIPKAFFQEETLYGHLFLLLHGDDIRSYYGMPHYGIERACNRLTTLLAAKGRFLKYLCLAHFHQVGVLDKVSGEKIINGSWVGFNEYALGSRYTGSEPKQVAFVVDEKRIRSREHICLLDALQTA